MSRTWTLYWVILVCTLFLVPATAYLLTYTVSDAHTGDAFASLIAQYQQSKRNPILTALLALFPFLLLALGLFIAKKRGVNEPRRSAICLGGGLAIAGVMLWANLIYWPNFLPDVPYPGFPHGLELVIAPLFFAPVAMLIGILLGRLLSP